ncbi:hypothetical protein [Rhizobium leguminosarum]|uniref:hypothetical protein n=1 Tax=Rhizobium leguminosarum TaxID=384 RepID=UPI001FEED40B|nr:hypothetical protein [Rhizobium leguminosarum]
MKITFLTAIAALFLGGVAATQAAEIDINGMALGMSADQVIAKFQDVRPDAQYEFVKWKLPEGTEWVAVTFSIQWFTEFKIVGDAEAASADESLVWMRQCADRQSHSANAPGL